MLKLHILFSYQDVNILRQKKFHSREMLQLADWVGCGLHTVEAVVIISKRKKRPLKRALKCQSCIHFLGTHLD